MRLESCVATTRVEGDVCWSLESLESKWIWTRSTFMTLMVHSFEICWKSPLWVSSFQSPKSHQPASESRLKLSWPEVIWKGIFTLLLGRIPFAHEMFGLRTSAAALRSSTTLSGWCCRACQWRSKGSKGNTTTDSIYSKWRTLSKFTQKLPNSNWILFILFQQKIQIQSGEIANINRCRILAVLTDIFTGLLAPCLFDGPRAGILESLQMNNQKITDFPKSQEIVKYNNGYMCLWYGA